MIALNETGGNAAAPVTLTQLETQAAFYERESVQLEELVMALEADLEAVRQRHLRAIKKQAAGVAGVEAGLQRLIAAAPHLFIKPRTLTLHGVKVGYTQSPGSVEFDDPEQVVAQLKLRYKRSAGTYLRVTETPNKEALRALSPTELAELGCRVEAAGDKVVLKRVAGEVEKLVNKIIQKLVAAVAQADRQ